MRKSALLVVIFSLTAASSPLIAQNSQSPQQHAPDGGTIERVVGPRIPAIPGAPFSASLVTEWTRLLPDGTVGTIKNRRLVARDSSGRVFEEHRNFAPDGDQHQTRLAWTNYVDPERHEFYACVPESHLCELAPLGLPAGPAPSVQSGSPGTQPSQAVVSAAQGQSVGSHPAMPEVKTESLGEQRIENLEVTGSREIATIPQGAFGNPNSEPVVKEFWYSDRLGINILTRRFDPRVSSSQVFTLTGINLSEPDPKLFLVPDYQVIQVPTANAAAVSASVMSPAQRIQPPSAGLYTR